MRPYEPGALSSPLQAVVSSIIPPSAAYVHERLESAISISYQEAERGLFLSPKVTLIDSPPDGFLGLRNDDRKMNGLIHNRPSEQE
jgi:hypothetical protein